MWGAVSAVALMDITGDVGMVFLAVLAFAVLLLAVELLERV